MWLKLTCPFIKFIYEIKIKREDEYYRAYLKQPNALEISVSFFIIDN